MPSIPAVVPSKISPWQDQDQNPVSREVQMADSTKFRVVVTWRGAFSKVICLITVDFLSVTDIPDRNVNRPARIVCLHTRFILLYACTLSNQIN